MHASKFIHAPASMQVGSSAIGQGTDRVLGRRKHAAAKNSVRFSAHVLSHPMGSNMGMGIIGETGGECGELGAVFMSPPW